MRTIQFLAPGTVTAQGDKGKEKSWGFKGGKGGTVSKITKISANGEHKFLPLQVNREYCDIGTEIEFSAGSGGGWGNPYERDPDLVLNDYLDEIISLEKAEEDDRILLGYRRLALAILLRACRDLVIDGGVQAARAAGLPPGVTLADDARAFLESDGARWLLLISEIDPSSLDAALGELLPTERRQLRLLD